MRDVRATGSVRLRAAALRWWVRWCSPARVLRRALVRVGVSWSSAAGAACRAFYRARARRFGPRVRSRLRPRALLVALPAREQARSSVRPSSRRRHLARPGRAHLRRRFVAVGQQRKCEAAQPEHDRSAHDRDSGPRVRGTSAEGLIEGTSRTAAARAILPASARLAALSSPGRVRFDRFELDSSLAPSGISSDSAGPRGLGSGEVGVIAGSLAAAACLAASAAAPSALGT